VSFTVIIAVGGVAIRTFDSRDGEGVVEDFERGLIYRV
jgi:hypothetical protein